MRHGFDLSTTRKGHQQNWHPEDIKAGLRKRGIILTRLSLEHDYSPDAVSLVVRGHRRSAPLERIIARCLNVQPQTIWPDRYQPDGTFKRRPRKKRAQRRGAS